MQTLSQLVISALREASNPTYKPTFVRGDARFIASTTVIVMPNGDTSMFCALNYQEKRMVLDANRTGGGRWLKDGSFTMFKKDMA